MATAHRGLRVLRIAQRRSDSAATLSNGAASGLTWIGLVGMTDPTQPEITRDHRVRDLDDDLEQESIAVQRATVTSNAAITTRAETLARNLFDERGNVIAVAI